MLSMKPELGISVPSSKDKDEIKDVLFVLLRQKALDHWNDALQSTSQSSRC